MEPSDRRIGDVLLLSRLRSGIAEGTVGPVEFDGFFPFEEHPGFPDRPFRDLNAFRQESLAGGDFHDFVDSDGGFRAAPNDKGFPFVPPSAPPSSPPFVPPPPQLPPVIPPGVIPPNPPDPTPTSAGTTSAATTSAATTSAATTSAATTSAATTSAATTSAATTSAATTSAMTTSANTDCPDSATVQECCCPSGSAGGSCDWESVEAMEAACPCTETGETGLLCSCCLVAAGGAPCTGVPGGSCPRDQCCWVCSYLLPTATKEDCAESGTLVVLCSIDCGPLDPLIP